MRIGSKKDSLFRMVMAVVMAYVTIIGWSPVYGKDYIVTVVDSLSGEVLPGINVLHIENNKSSFTDENGSIRITEGPSGSIRLSSIGYAPKQITLNQRSSDTLFIPMVQKPFELEEVVVGKKKNKYSKRNNPAVDLIGNVRKDWKILNPSSKGDYSYEFYEKLLIGGNDISADYSLGRGRGKELFKEYIDTAPWTGKRIIDLALFEKSGVRLFESEGKKDKTLVNGLRSQGLHEMIPADNIREMLEDVFREIDIHAGDITLMQNRFVSPLSPIGPDFYMYEITDTVSFGGDRCVEVTFAPKTPETFGFNGKLFIPQGDSLRYIKRVMMRVPKAINLNYVDNIFVSQNFEQDSLGMTHKVLDDICLEMSIMKIGPSLYVSRQTRYDNFCYNKRKEYTDYYNSLGTEIEEEGALSRGEEFWDERRKIPLTYAERRLSGLSSELRSVKWINIAEKAVRILFQGYVGTRKEGSKFNIGPVNTFISYNNFEGLRLKFGGMTTAAFSDRIFFRGYGAYGFKDHKWKYDLEGEYSFIKKKNHSREFPMNAIRLTYKNDVNQIGVRYLYTNSDNFILSIKRRSNDLFTYRRIAAFEYNLELLNNLSFNVGFFQTKEEASDRVIFKNGFDEFVKSYRIGGLSATVRYAPGEKFVQGISNRRPINMDAPIFTISQAYGRKGWLGNNFTLNKTEISASKRFWLSAFGYVNVLLKGGIIWSEVPFPSLLWQNANLSYTIQQETFALLNPMEFALDRYVSWDMEYFISGAILNRIPLVKKSKLREILTFKGFWGKLSDKNNPQYNNRLFRFPDETSTYLMGPQPYMEIGVGLDNILTILRLDYVWRLTYRNIPGVDRQGLRVSLHLSF